MPAHIDLNGPRQQPGTRALDAGCLLLLRSSAQGWNMARYTGGQGDLGRSFAFHQYLRPAFGSGACWWQPGWPRRWRAAVTRRRRYRFVAGARRQDPQWSEAETRTGLFCDVQAVARATFRQKWPALSARHATPLKSGGDQVRSAWSDMLAAQPRG